MKLVSMKRSKKEREKTAKPSAGLSDSYGYGLRLCLEKEQLDKLDLDLPKVGQTFKIETLATVISVSQNEGEYSNKRVEFQIKELGLEKITRSMADAVRDGLKDADED